MTQDDPSESRTQHVETTANVSVGPHSVSNNHDNVTAKSPSVFVRHRKRTGIKSRAIHCLLPDSSLSIEWLHHTAAHPDDFCGQLTKVGGFAFSIDRSDDVELLTTNRCIRFPGDVAESFRQKLFVAPCGDVIEPAFNALNE